jgi:glycosyltransferase involved in cell wall biosynthesis
MSLKKLLFISRTYPPIVGGLETHNQALHEALLSKIPVESIINQNGKKALFWFLPLATLKTVFHARGYKFILLGDGLLAILGWFVKLIHPDIPVICIIHGLDITYTNPIYQRFWIRLFLPRMDRVIAVSNATADTAIQKGLDPSKIVVIPNGVYSRALQMPRDREKLNALLHTETANKIILFTLGRLVKRKGVNWFIQQVMPEIADRCIYLIAGDGPEKVAINKSIHELRLDKSVFCIGFVSEELKTLFFSNADLFIQPNIKVKGDMEGFGIAVLEANTYGLAVLGSNLEGLQDSITENQNGWLLEHGKASAYVQKIRDLSEHSENIKQAGENAKIFCHEQFSWDRIAEQYLAVVTNLTTQAK